MRTNHYLCLILILSLFNIHCLNAQTTFFKHSLGSPSLPTDIYSVDVNGDDYLDLLISCASNNGEASWWENNGEQSFTKHLLGNDVPGMRSIRPIDFDQDGYVDIMTAAWGANEIALWVNDGSQNFTKQIIDNNFLGAHTLDIADLDQDGDPDFLCSGFNQNSAIGEVAWWENQDGAFIKHLVSERFKLSTFVLGTDLNQDGFLDILACCEHNGDVVWWENNGEMEFTEREIDTDFSKAHTLVVKDLDKDGDPDILAAACLANKLAWYRNEGNGIFRKNLLPDLGWAMWLDAADMDLDGDYDMLATGMNATSIRGYWNNGNALFQETAIPKSFTSGFALNICDLDQDNDPDILAIGNQSNSLVWFENMYQAEKCLESPSWVEIDPVSSKIFVSNEAIGEVVLVYNELESIINNGLGIASGLAFQAGYIYVANGPQLIRLDPINGENRGSIRLPAAQLSSLSHDSQGFVYAADPITQTIFKVGSELSNYESLTLKGLESPHAIWVDRNRNELVVLDHSINNQIKVFSLTSLECIRTIALDNQNTGDICGDSESRIFFSIPDNDMVMMINPESDRLIVVSTEVDEPYGLCLGPIEDELIVVSKAENSIEHIHMPALGIASQTLSKPGVEFWYDSNTNAIRINGSINELDAPILRLYNIQGQLIEETPIRSLSGSTGTFFLSSIKNGTIHPGIYLIEIQSRQMNFAQKIYLQ